MKRGTKGFGLSLVFRGQDGFRCRLDSLGQCGGLLVCPSRGEGGVQEGGVHVSRVTQGGQAERGGLRCTGQPRPPTHTGPLKFY